MICVVESSDIIGINCELEEKRLQMWDDQQCKAHKRGTTVPNDGDPFVVEINGMVPSCGMEGRSLEGLDTLKFGGMEGYKENSGGRDHNLCFLKESFLRPRVLRVHPVELTLVIPVHGGNLSI